jgi:hypothetical protein
MRKARESPRGGTGMERSGSHKAGYFLAAMLGAVAGGVAVALGGRILPSMMSKVMADMMAQMGGEGCDPEEM